MSRFGAWLSHSIGIVIVALISTGAIYDLVPVDHQRQAIAVCMVILYLAGVKMPTPPTGVAAAEAAANQAQAEAKKVTDSAKGPGSLDF